MVNTKKPPSSSNNNQVVTIKEATIPLQCPSLTATNYSIWAIKLKAIFNVHGLWEVIEPEAGVDVDVKKNNQAIAYLYQAMPEDMILQVADLTTAQAVWDAMKTRFVGIDRVKKARLASLRSEFEKLKMKESDTIDEFAGKLSAIATKATQLGEPFSESVLVKKLMSSVPDRFIQIVASMEQFLDLDTMLLPEAIGRLKAFEERTSGRVKHGQEKDDQLLLTYSQWQSRSKEFESRKRAQNSKDRDRGRPNRGGKGWTSQKGKTSNSENGRQPHSFERKGKDKSKIKCFRCEELGHYASECPSKNKDPEANLTQTYDDEPALLMAEVDSNPKELVFLNESKFVPSNLDKEPRCSDVWYLDNGASNHMTGNYKAFSVLDRNVGGSVKFGDGSSVIIEGRGSVILDCKNGEQRMIGEVYYIPMLKSNILSLGQATEGGCEVRMKDDYLWLYEKSGRLLMKVQRSQNRLYKIALKIGSPMCFQTQLDDEAWVWHGRLGHVNFDTMKKMVVKGMVTGVPVVNKPLKLCEACLAGKHTRAPFPTKSLYRSEKPLELISIDLCGPITPETKAGNKYFMLMVDDCTRFTWVSMLKSKDQALNAFKEFKCKVEKEFDLKIKCVRSDRGGEFMSHEFKVFCDCEGIKRQLTTPYTPQHNGMVERRNKTVLNMTRSLLKAMCLPQELWAEAVRHSIYLLNRLPTRALDDCTPYEKLKGRKPQLAHLRVFGCTAHVKTTQPGQKKLDDRSVPMIYLGPEEGTKGQRLYNPVTRKLVISRDIHFEENRKWEWSKGALEGADMDHSWVEFNVQYNESDPMQADGSSDEVEGHGNNIGQPESSGSHTQSQSQQSTVRRSSRVSTLPSRMNDFVLDEWMQSRVNREEEESLDLLLAQEGLRLSFQDALKEEVWRDAMDTEIQAIERNKTWTLVDLPPKVKPIGLKWLYKVKKDASGTRHKARLVAKGYVQKYGVDFDDGFAPVARMETIRLILAVSARLGWTVHHLDVKAAFLNGILKENVYVQQPQGYEVKGAESKVYKLSKALYGLKQAPRTWNKCLDEAMTELGFDRCQREAAVYLRTTNASKLVVGVYVDDLIVAGSDIKEVEKFKSEISTKFEMTDLGLLSYYLGIEVNQRKEGIFVTQSAYAKKVLKLAGMEECNETKVPMEPGLKLGKVDDSPEVDHTEYRKLIGSLRYLTHTRPDLMYAVGYLSRFMQAPKEAHWKAIKQVVRYVKGTLYYGVRYSRDKGEDLMGYSDSNYAAGDGDGKCTSGNVFYYNSCPVTWNSHKQQTVALSSCEAEFMAATTAACQAVWLQGVLDEIMGQKQKLVMLKVDNRSALALMKDPVFHGKSKHIETKYYFIRDCIGKGKIQVEFVSGSLQRADILTKALPRMKFSEMRCLIGVEDLSDDSWN